tara:strand:+ start:1094 stop:1282 length:189 start_codon:yes stop_codon:yes gene_type:complete
MAYHITRPGKLDGRTMYYHGGNRWSDESIGRVNYSTKAEADAMLVNTDGKNGGFNGATVVKS